MSFTATPDYDNTLGWKSFIGTYVILEPMTKQLQQPTKFGTQDFWDCIVWQLSPETNELIPFSGVRIFNTKIVSALDLAYKTGRPIAGHVHAGGANGQATVVEADGSPTMELLEKLWSQQG